MPPPTRDARAEPRRRAVGAPRARPARGRGRPGRHLTIGEIAAAHRHPAADRAPAAAHAGRPRLHAPGARPPLRPGVPARARSARPPARWWAPAPSACSAGLVDALGETANLAMLDGDRVAYVAQVPGRHAMRMFTEVGRRVHPHCTGGRQGRAVRGPRGRRPGAARPHRAPAAHRATRSPTSTRSSPSSTRCARAATRSTRASRRSGVRCLAVRLPGSAVQMGLSISGPAPRMTDDLLAEAVPILQSAAQDLAATIA